MCRLSRQPIHRLAVKAMQRLLHRAPLKALLRAPQRLAMPVLAIHRLVFPPRAIPLLAIRLTVTMLPSLRLGPSKRRA